MPLARKRPRTLDIAPQVERDPEVPPAIPVYQAAIQYGIIADWFEQRPITKDAHRLDAEAFDLFNRAEAQLRESIRQAVLMGEKGDRHRMKLRYIPRHMLGLDGGCA
jgi:hypothetical protein